MNDSNARKSRKTLSIAPAADDSRPASLRSGPRARSAGARTAAYKKADAANPRHPSNKPADSRAPTERRLPPDRITDPNEPPIRTRFARDDRPAFDRPARAAEPHADAPSNRHDAEQPAERRRSRPYRSERREAAEQQPDVTTARSGGRGFMKRALLGADSAPSRFGGPARAPAARPTLEANGLTLWFAPCPRGLEQPLADELVACGAPAVQIVPGGAQFTGDQSVGLAVNLRSRIASRVLRQLDQARYRDEQDIYGIAHAYDWQALFKPERSIKVEVVGQHAPVQSLEFVTLRIKDAICDQFRDRTGIRPDVDTRDPDVRIHAFLDSEHITLYVDTSGEALFKRGWRRDKVAAPLRENLAAGMLALAGWTPDQPLLDPFCGSGTLAIEAALIAKHQPSGLVRHFGFEALNDFDSSRWDALRTEATAAIDETPATRIFASDISINAIPITRANCASAGVSIGIKQVDARDMQPPTDEPGLIICNPPYGERVHVRGKVSEGEADDDTEFFAELASTFKKRFAGWRVAILSSDPQLAAKMRLKPSKTWPLYNGALACKLFVFNIVAGSNRKQRGGGVDEAV